MKRSDFNQDAAIQRFQECHLGFTPADIGYPLTAEYENCYVYANTEENLKIFFKFEKYQKFFKIGFPISLFLFLVVLAWVIISPLLLNIIIMWLIGLLLFAETSYVIYYSDQYKSVVLRNIILIKKLRE